MYTVVFIRCPAPPQPREAEKKTKENMVFQMIDGKKRGGSRSEQRAEAGCARAEGGAVARGGDSDSDFKQESDDGSRPVL